MSSFAVTEDANRTILPAALVIGSVFVLAASIASGVLVPAATGFVLATTLLALARPRHIGWPRMLAALILIILLVPIRRYSLPGDLPFELEPYRIFVAVLLLGWGASLLVDARTQIRRTGFEGPLLLIVGAAFASIVANPGRVALNSSIVEKKLTFFLSFVLVFYLIASAVRRLDNIDYLVMTLVVGGAIVAAFAIVEARSGFNVFSHLAGVVPLLEPGAQTETEAFKKFGTARLRVFGSAEHPIALSAAFVVLAPLAVYLARRYRRRLWVVCSILLVAGVASTISRTGIMMLVVAGLVFLWLRPMEMRRLWPVLIPALIVVKLALPGTLGAIKQSFLPPGGLVAEQRVKPGEVGSGRIADLGPGLAEWRGKPLFGQGFGTRVVDSSVGTPNANILDNQWLGTLLETGALGFFGWLWFFVRVVRRFGAEAKRDYTMRGALLASLAASAAAFGVGMFTFDAFSFIQVTFLLFILVGLGAALLNERPTPVAVTPRRRWVGAGARPAHP
jgi:O-antigen ligase